jgi:hypothetical protein
VSTSRESVEADLALSKTATTKYPRCTSISGIKNSSVQEACMLVRGGKDLLVPLFLKFSTLLLVGIGSSPLIDQASAASRAPASETPPDFFLPAYARPPEETSLEQELGEKAVQSIDEIIESEQKPQISMIKELNLTQKEAATVRSRLRKLAADLKNAESRRASRNKRMIILDHQSWMREFLGPIRYERYLEITEDAGLPRKR